MKGNNREIQRQRIENKLIELADGVRPPRVTVATDKGDTEPFASIFERLATSSHAPNRLAALVLGRQIGLC